MYLQHSPHMTSVVAGFFLLTSFAVSQEHYPEVTYEEVEHFNATCPFLNDCEFDRDEDSLETYNCNCKEFCDEYDTCCVDSKHRDQMSKVRKPYKCVRIYGRHEHVFMINSCEPSWNGDHMEYFCLATAEEVGDIFSTVSVTNKKTRITYKNYACALCNNEEDLEQLTFWPMYLMDRSTNKVLSTYTTSNIPNVHYNYSAEAWLMHEEADNIVRKVVIPYFHIPKEIKDNVFHCFPGVISECATNWTDKNINDKCRAYMTLVRAYAQDGSRKMYRNPHCAVCNYQSPNYHLACRGIHKNWDFGSSTFFVRLFSFYDKESKCDDDQIYDTIAKKCRKVYRG